MPDIRDRVEQDRGLLKKIQLVIPGYAGYRRREDIRAADNLLRIQLANQLKGVRGDLETIRDQMAMDGKIQGLQGIGNIIFTVEGLEAKVRHAEGGVVLEKRNQIIAANIVWGFHFRTLTSWTSLHSYRL